MRVTHRNHLNNALAECKADADDDGKKGKQVMPTSLAAWFLERAPGKITASSVKRFIADKTEVALFRSRP